MADGQSPLSRARRKGVKLTSEGLLEGLKEQFNSLDKLHDNEQASISWPLPNPLLAMRTKAADIGFIRILTPKEFKEFLRIHGVPIDDFGRAEYMTKTVKELWAEVVLRECRLVQVGNAEVPGGLSLARIARVIYLEIEAHIGSESKFLLLVEDKRTDAKRKGSKRANLNMRPSKKMFDDEEPEEAVWRSMHQNLNFKEKVAQRQFTIVSLQHSREEKESEGFPGLPTIYDIYVAHLQVVNVHDPQMEHIGLPNGTNFETYKEFALNRMTRTWSWCSTEVFETAKAARAGVITQEPSDLSFDGLAEGLCAGMICLLMSQPLYYACGHRYEICLHASRILTLAYVGIFTLVGLQAKKVHAQRGGSAESTFAKLAKETCVRLKNVTLTGASFAAKTASASCGKVRRNNSAKEANAQKTWKPKQPATQNSDVGEVAEVEDHWLMCCLCK